MTVLPALTYSVSSRLVLDGGCYAALHRDLPRVTFFMGVAYSVIDLYHHLCRAPSIKINQTCCHTAI